jgi:hypothetical protein
LAREVARTPAPDAARPLALEVTDVGASIGMTVGAGGSTAVGVRVERHCSRHE